MLPPTVGHKDNSSDPWGSLPSCARFCFEDGGTGGTGEGELNPAGRCQDPGLPGPHEAGVIPSPSKSPVCPGMVPAPGV